jgi:hypothetical protein
VSPEEHDYLAAEARARKRIDEKLVEAGWKVQDRAKANLYASHGVALRDALAAVREVGAATLPRPSADHSHRRVMVTIGRRPPLRGCDEDPLAGFVTPVDRG